MEKIKKGMEGIIPQASQRRNTFADGLTMMSENQGTVDSPLAEELDCIICQSCLKYEPVGLNQIEESRE